MNSEFLDQQFLGNTVTNYLLCVGILLIGFIFKRFISSLLIRLLYFIFRKYGRSVGWEQFTRLTNRPFQLLFMVILVYFAIQRLAFPAEWRMAEANEFGLRMVLYKGFLTMMVFSAFWVVVRLIDFVFLINIERARNDLKRSDDQVLPFLKEAVKVVIAGIGFLGVISVAFNLDVVGLVAGLGIGGLAFALAAKETLENLLGSFTIFLDKPFSVGQLVKVGAVEGKVESIGFRSTRIRPADQTLVTMPNKKMVDAEVINESYRLKRKSVFTFALSLRTTEEQMEQILSGIRHELHLHERVQDELIQVSFRNITSSSLEIFVSFFVLSPLMEDFLLIQEEINFKILGLIRNAGASFPPMEEAKREQ